VKQVKRLILLLTRLRRSKIEPLSKSLTSSWTNYEREGQKMENDFNQSNYSTDQMAEIYAKLEVSKMLIKLGTDMAKQASDDIRFFRMTNGIED
jgi:hypothetical protein